MRNSEGGCLQGAARQLRLSLASPLGRSPHHRLSPPNHPHLITSPHLNLTIHPSPTHHPRSPRTSRKPSLLTRARSPPPPAPWCRPAGGRDEYSYGGGNSEGYDEVVTVAKVQVGLMASARELQKDLERIADKADTDSPGGLHYILQGALGGAAAVVWG